VGPWQCDSRPSVLFSPFSLFWFVGQHLCEWPGLPRLQLLSCSSFRFGRGRSIHKIPTLDLSSLMEVWSFALASPVRASAWPLRRVTLDLRSLMEVWPFALASPVRASAWPLRRVSSCFPDTTALFLVPLVPLLHYECVRRHPECFPFQSSCCQIAPAKALTNARYFLNPSEISEICSPGAEIVTSWQHVNSGGDASRFCPTLCSTYSQLVARKTSIL
jgi:hypothetical protein